MSMTKCPHGIPAMLRCDDCQSTTPQSRLTDTERLHQWLNWWYGVMQPQGVGASDAQMRRMLAERFINHDPNPI